MKTGIKSKGMFDENPKYIYESSLGSDKFVSEQLPPIVAVKFSKIELVKLNLYGTLLWNYIFTFTFKFFNEFRVDCSVQACD